MAAPVAICKEHTRVLHEAAIAYGCADTGEQFTTFVADVLISGLYEPANLLGDAVTTQCICCAFLDPNAAIREFVTIAMAQREKTTLPSVAVN